ncbi:MAG: phenylalanine--tRNA ligase subunit alpha [Candidatus Omnitrophica bacterium]|nr:phenylalanine--tRNA ligase subunit alpha [Candidatus Omnitrophota bacterium]MBU1997643.1 phenylalanine--tRNA ligase subunit alpha [Candidatus Omnitrophota bacterium]
MEWDFQSIRQEAQKEAISISDQTSLESFRIKYLGKKGLIPQVYSSLATASKEEKPLLGKNVNELKNFISGLIEEKKQSVKDSIKQASKSNIDVTLPGVASDIGHSHLLTQTMEEICGLFEKLGFIVQEGPEIETEFNNFDALNIPSNHPSRDGFDTFYVDKSDPDDKDKKLLLRSQTSPVQIRVMKANKPPLAVVVPGKVYRPDAVDASHSFMFHQIEGLLVDKDVKFSHLKGLLTTFCKRFFGDKIKMRFRPHFFPFTEPSAEIDISWEQGKKDWLEIMGCGMVHPQVFKAVGYPKGKYTGLAFGLGVERIAMLRYGIRDIRLFYENDKRFLEQF